MIKNIDEIITKCQIGEEHLYQEEYEQVARWLEEYKEIKNNEDRCVDLIYDLLNEYDMGVWEDIEYIKLADFWIRTIRLSSYADLEKEWPIKERLRNFLGGKNDV